MTFTEWVVPECVFSPHSECCAFPYADSAQDVHLTRWQHLLKYAVMLQVLRLSYALELLPRPLIARNLCSCNILDLEHFVKMLYTTIAEAESLCLLG